MKDKNLRFLKKSEAERDRLSSNVPDLQPGMTFRPFGWLMMGGLKGWMTCTFLAITSAEVVDLTTVFLTKLVIDTLSSNTPQAIGFTTVLWLVLSLAISGFIQSLFWRLSGYCASHYSMAYEARIQQALFRYLSQHNPGYFFNHFAGALATKVRNVSDGYFDLLDAIHWTIIGAIISLLGALFLFSRIHIYLVLILCVWFVLFSIAYIFLGKKKQLYSRHRADENSRKTGRLVDAISNMLTITLFSRHKQEEMNLTKYLYRSFDAGRGSWRYTDLMNFVSSTLSLTARLFLLSVTAGLWFNGQATTGDVVLIFSISATMSTTLRQFGNMMNRLYGSLGSIQEGLEILLVPHGITDVADAKPLEVTKGQIDFDHVEFAYPGRDPVLENFMLSIQPGDKVGLVGRSGAGKTTLVSLLLRFYDVTGGAIKIDGQDLSQIQQATLRSQVAVVPQEPLLFHRTILENIQYGDLEATEEQVAEAAKLALAHDFILALPEGYNTKVGERGVKLSGGQRQRIAIARAILKNAPILVLDEATASLDSESELAISEALHNLVKDKTVIAVAHRLSTLREMTRIVVMDGGKIIEDGNHEALLAKGGLYAGLWQTQAGGFLQDEE